MRRQDTPILQIPEMDNQIEAAPEREEGQGFNLTFNQGDSQKEENAQNLELIARLKNRDGGSEESSSGEPIMMLNDVKTESENQQPSKQQIKIDFASDDDNSEEVEVQQIELAQPEVVEKKKPWDSIATEHPVEHAFIDAVKFVQEQTERIQNYTDEVQNELQIFEDNINPLTLNIADCEQECKDVIKKVNVNVESGNETFKQYMDAEVHLLSTNEIAKKIQKNASEIEDQPLSSTGLKFEKLLDEDFQGVKSKLDIIEGRLTEIRGAKQIWSSSKPADIVKTTMYRIGQMVQNTVQNVCTVEAKVGILTQREEFKQGCDILSQTENQQLKNLSMAVQRLQLDTKKQRKELPCQAI
eukprot:UN31888